MKKNIVSGIIGFAAALFAAQIGQAQGVVYLSNLEQPSAGGSAVGSDSWLAEGFFTGTNSGGYSLNSIQLAMTDASGNPSGFTVSLYSALQNREFSPGTSLGSLSGSSNPSTAGIFAFTPVANFTLLPNTAYFIVLASGTIVASGAFDWSHTSTFPSSYNQTGGWNAPLAVGAIDNYQSSDGSSWNFLEAFPQFAITATAIPEPGVLSLFALGGLCFLWQRRKAKAV